MIGSYLILAITATNSERAKKQIRLYSFLPSVFLGNDSRGCLALPSNHHSQRLRGEANIVLSASAASFMCTLANRTISYVWNKHKESFIITQQYFCMKTYFSYLSKSRVKTRYLLNFLQFLYLFFFQVDLKIVTDYARDRTSSRPPHSSLRGECKRSFRRRYDRKCMTTLSEATAERKRGRLLRTLYFVVDEDDL